MTPKLLQRPQARTEWKRSRTMLHPECPVEQALRSADPVVQAELLQEIWRRPSFVEEGALLVADPKCLRILARSEGALRVPVDRLRQRYGAGLIVEPASVRYAHGAPVLEPYMTLLLIAPERYLPLLQQDLARRRGCIRRIDLHGGPFVLEAEAPLANLLGYGDWLRQRMEADADAGMWLSRYVPIDDGPQAA